jgi:hypothetical protein
MSQTILIFANLGRQDAHIWVAEEDGTNQFVAKLASGATLRHLSMPGQRWNVVAEETYEVRATDKNRVYLIGSAGLYEVDHTRAVPSDGGTVPADFDFPGMGGGGWP